MLAGRSDGIALILSTHAWNGLDNPEVPGAPKRPRDGPPILSAVPVLLYLMGQSSQQGQVLLY